MVKRWLTDLAVASSSPARGGVPLHSLFAQLVKCWPTDLEVASSSPARGGDPLYTAHRPDMTEKLL